MLDGVMLIVITMFAVLGAYFMSDMLTEYVFRKNTAPRVVVVLANDSVEQVWNSVVDAHTRLPECEIIVLCDKDPDVSVALEPALRNVSYASAQTLGADVYRILKGHLQEKTNDI